MPWKSLGWLAVAVFLTRAPFVPPTLEDYDSVNFALALEDYDPLAHQPHPPGYPVYVALARLSYAIVPEPSLALGLLSALSQALAVFPAFAVFSRLAPRRGQAWLATVLLFVCPVLWFNGARPMSDSTGLLFGLAAQALLLRQLETGRGLVAGSFVAALAVGVRLQTVLLTAPLWLLGLRRGGGRVKAAAALALGAVAWLVPLLVASGGPARYLAAFGHTMGMALDIEPLFTRFSVNLAVRAARYVLLAPSIEPLLGVPILALALAGGWHLWRSQRSRLWLSLACFGPYLIAHALFHQVEAIRYTILYLPLASLLVAAGIGWLVGQLRAAEPRHTELALTALLVVSSATLTLPALWIFSTVESPPAAAVRAVRALAPRSPGFVLASHYTLQRYIGTFPASLEVLPSGPNQALAQLDRYWVEGGEKPGLFLADSRRTDLVSMDRRARRTIGRWVWPLHVDRFMPGARPARAELLRIEPPDWIAGAGWLLSLEAGRPEAVATLPERHAHLRSVQGSAFLLLTGEPRGEASGCTLAVERDGEPVGSFPCTQPFLHGIHMPPVVRAGYSELKIRPLRSGGDPAPVLLRGLDYGSVRQPGWAHGVGWHYPERDEQGHLFLWTSARALSLLHVPEGGGWLRVEGAAPVAYVGVGGLVRVMAAGTELARTVVTEPTFRLEAHLTGGPEAFREVSLETDRTFVPHDFQRSGDQRELGLRVYRFELRIPSRPGSADATDPSRAVPGS